MSMGNWLTVTEAAKELGVNGSYLRRLLEQGRLQGQLKGNTWLMPSFVAGYQGATGEAVGRRRIFDAGAS